METGPLPTCPPNPATTSNSPPLRKAFIMQNTYPNPLPKTPGLLHLRLGYLATGKRHGVALPSTGLSIGEETTVVAFQHVLHQVSTSPCRPSQRQRRAVVSRLDAQGKKQESQSMQTEKKKHTKKEKNTLHLRLNSVECPLSRCKGRQSRFGEELTDLRTVLLTPWSGSTHTHLLVSSKTFKNIQSLPLSSPFQDHPKNSRDGQAMLS